MFLFDIDHFKHYNDTNGHLAGDKLLQALSRIVPETIRKDDTFGRFGGEEFLLSCPTPTWPRPSPPPTRSAPSWPGTRSPLPSASP